jgi:hypothetical protein
VRRYVDQGEKGKRHHWKEHHSGLEDDHQHLAEFYLRHLHLLNYLLQLLSEVCLCRVLLKLFQLEFQVWNSRR